MILRDYQQSAVDAAINWIKYRQHLHGFITAPGGSGKSLMIARVAQACREMGKNVIILARNEKLLRQNRAKFDPEYQNEIGIYCAGLNEWSLDKPIIIASIQSISSVPIQNAENLIILVDECQNISPDSEDETQYWTFFRACGNPQIIGFTATPFRTKSGKIQWGDEIINIPIKPLIERGFLVAPVNKVTVTPDLSQVTIRMGEYVQNQLEEIFLEPELLSASVAKIQQYSADRHSVLIFTQSVKHAQILSETMELNDMPNIMVTGETPKDELADILDSFEKRYFEYLINVQLLTEGYDAPCVDMIVVLRSTISKGLFEQIAYRGTRPFPDKKNFLLLDMGGNLMRHGALGSPCQESGKEDTGSSGKICPSCEEYNPRNSSQCVSCGYEFIKDAPRKVSHDAYADLDSETVYEPRIEEYIVESVRYSEHKNKKKGTISLRVDYVTQFAKYGSISEWVAVYSDNEYARERAWRFFKDRGHKLASDTKTYSMEDIIWHCTHLKQPKKIIVDMGEKFPRIKEYIWHEEEPNRSYDPEGASQVVADILADDAILF